MGVLRNPRHELFARERAYLTPVLRAAQVAGYERMTPGNAAKLDRHPKIRARIAELSKADEEYAAQRRAMIARSCEHIAQADVVDLFEPAVGLDGKPIDGKLKLKDLTRLAPELRMAIKSVVLVDGKPQVELYDRVQALQLLTKIVSPVPVERAPAGDTFNLNVLNAPEGAQLDYARRMAFLLENAARGREAGTKALEGTKG